MTNAQLVKAFNEWMRRFIEEPERFEAEFQSVNQFLKDEAKGNEPSYGESCVAMLRQLDADMRGHTEPPVPPSSDD